MPLRYPKDSNGGLSRYERLIREEINGRRTTRHFGPSHPVFFKTKDNLLIPCKPHIKNLKSNRNAGQFILSDNHVVSIGRKLDLTNPEKFLGIRPDVSQERGDEQLKFSIVGGHVNGAELDVKTLLTNSVVSQEQNRCRVILDPKLADESVLESFSVTYRLHLKNLTLFEVGRESVSEFRFYSELDNQFRFKIGLPQFIDLNTLQAVPTDCSIQHRIHSDAVGNLYYTKEYTQGPPVTTPFIGIDAHIIYSDSSDGWIQKTSMTSWTDCHDATSGTNVLDTNDRVGDAVRIDVTASTIWSITRSFFYLETGSLSGTVESGSIFLYGYASNDNTVTFVSGTQGDTLVSDDFDACGTTPFTSIITGVDIADYEEFLLSTDGKAGINKSGITKLALRDKLYDVNDQDPGTSVDYTTGCYFANSTYYPPYAEITTSGGRAITKKIFYVTNGG